MGAHSGQRKNKKKKKKPKSDSARDNRDDGRPRSSPAKSDIKTTFCSSSQLLPWSPTVERARYAALGCHIAKPPFEDSSSYPWILGAEPFDPDEYHPEDLERIPEVAMNDGDAGGVDDDEYEDCGDCGMEKNIDGCERGGQKTLTVTNATSGVTKACYVTVYDVDLCGRDGQVLASGWTTVDDDGEEGTGSRNRDGDPKGRATLQQHRKMENEFPRQRESDQGRDPKWKRRKCTTFIVLCPPSTFVHLCYLASSENSKCNRGIVSWSQVEIESDVQPWSNHPNPTDAHPLLLSFPFRTSGSECEIDASDGGCEGGGGEGSESEVLQPSLSAAPSAFLCNQSEDGTLTHFFSGNYHAVDFACTVGTPLYAVARGEIVELRGGETSGGVASKDLFRWNSIMMRVDETETTADGGGGEIGRTGEYRLSEGKGGPLYVEYVHIQTGSAVVRVGDAVERGQFLCRSGSIGFSPEPHLHLAAYRSGEENAATVHVGFRPRCRDEDGGVGDDGNDAVDLERGVFVPRAGLWYDECGVTSKL